MKGLVYKDFSLFFKGIDKKLIIMSAAAVGLLLIKTGIYPGLLATFIIAMTIGMQNIMNFSCDEQVRWKKYQLTMPVNPFLAVGSKYIFVLFTTGLGIAASIFFTFCQGL